MSKETDATKENTHPTELSQKEKVLELLAVAMCLMLLLACFLKVMFF